LEHKRAARMAVKTAMMMVAYLVSDWAAQMDDSMAAAKAVHSVVLTALWWAE